MMTTAYAPRAGSRSSAGALVTLVACVVATGCAVDVAGSNSHPAAVLLPVQEVFSVQDTWSGYTMPTRTVIAGAQAWAAAWDRLHEHRFPKPASPAIDFTTDVIILAAMGERMTSGYSVAITETRVFAGVFYVTVHETSPEPTCGRYQALTAPVHIVQVPRRAVYAQFTVEQRTLSC
jgi:hypothetical protein